MPDHEERGGLLTLLLVYIIAGNAFAIIAFMPWDRPAWIAFSVLSAANVVFGVAILAWQKWGVYGYVASSLATIPVILLIAKDFPGMFWVLLAGPVLLVLLIRRHWHHMDPVSEDARSKPAADGVIPHSEADNQGTRQETASEASAYWLSRIGGQKFDPFVLSTFDTATQAKAALLDLYCIHVAADSSNLICTETLIFGFYETEEGKYEGILAGDDLSHALWTEARASFARHGGRLKNEQEPDKDAAPAAAEDGNAQDVVFVREDHREIAGQTMRYRVHRGPSASAAKAFLQQNPVDRQFEYIVVETPDGNYCRDIQGIYKE